MVLVKFVNKTKQIEHETFDDVILLYCILKYMPGAPAPNVAKAKYGSITYGF